MMIDGIKVKTYEVGTYEGLRLKGLEKATRGRVMLSRDVNGTGLGLRKRRHFTFRLRKGDGHRITRAGRLAGAKVTELDGKVTLVEFHLDWF